MSRRKTRFYATVDGIATDLISIGELSNGQLHITARMNRFYELHKFDWRKILDCKYSVHLTESANPAMGPMRTTTKTVFLEGGLEYKNVTMWKCEEGFRALLMSRRCGGHGQPESETFFDLRPRQKDNLIEIANTSSATTTLLYHVIICGAEDGFFSKLPHEQIFRTEFSRFTVFVVPTILSVPTFLQGDEMLVQSSSATLSAAGAPFDQRVPLQPDFQASPVDSFLPHDFDDIIFRNHNQLAEMLYARVVNWYRKAPLSPELMAAFRDGMGLPPLNSG
jgi:hypothetical protein